METAVTRDADPRFAKQNDDGFDAPMTDRLAATIAKAGFAFVRGDVMRKALDRVGSMSDWARFSASWNDLPLDGYMADGGRYRRRRHAVFSVAEFGGTHREPHQPHFQSLDYNALNGGVARWFEPIEVAGASLLTLLEFCRSLFGELSPAVAAWHVEVHQFRIEARAGEDGQPTPEGLHRDGVDHVLVLLVARHNIAQGTTTIHDLDRRRLGSFTLTHPFDAALVDDARVYHGVTLVEPIDPLQPAYRDVLVVTFRSIPRK